MVKSKHQFTILKMFLEEGVTTVGAGRVCVLNLKGDYIP